MNLLVTGGAGFIGSTFIKYQLRKEKWNSITVIDSLTYAGSRENLKEEISRNLIKFKQIDICDSEKVKSAFENIDYVVHFAAETHVDRSIKNPSQFIQTNVLGTQVLLNAALKSKIKKFIHISTDEVYGSINEGSWIEEEPIKPNSPYSASKASSDLLALSYHKTFGLNVIVTRCSNNYGPFQFPEKIIPLFITNIIEGKRLPLYGNGSNSRDWLHVEDHCGAINLILKEGKSGEIYNIGGGKELSNLDLTKRILNQFGCSENLIEYVEDRKGHDKRYSVDYSKIERELGYKPVKDFDQGLFETIEWYKNNTNWWLKRKNG